MEEITSILASITEQAVAHGCLEVAVVTSSMAGTVVHENTDGLRALAALAAGLSKKSLREIELERTPRRNLG